MKNHISLKKLTIHKYFLPAVAFALGLTGGLVAYAAGTYQSITPKSKGVFQYGDNVVLSGDEIKTIDDNLDIVNANLNGLKFDKDGSGNWGYYKPGDSQLTLFKTEVTKTLLVSFEADRSNITYKVIDVKTLLPDKYQDLKADNFSYEPTSVWYDCGSTSFYETSAFPDFGITYNNETGILIIKGIGFIDSRSNSKYNRYTTGGNVYIIQ